MCSVTSGAPITTFTDRGRAGGTIESLLHPLNYSLHYMGFAVLPPFLATEIQSAGFTYKSADQFDKDLQKNLARWENHLTGIDEIEPLPFPGWNDWDENGVEK